MVIHFQNAREIYLLQKPASPSRFLAFIRCGRTRPHIDLSEWQASGDIDVCYSFYEAPDFSPDTHHTYIINGGLSKYHAFEQLWNTEPWVRGYEAYWLIDYDVHFTSRDVLALFNEGLQAQALIWQPSVAPDSYTRWDHLYQRPGKKGLRNTNFVEVMAPLFSNAGMQRCVKTFSTSISTWGLDHVWSTLCSPAEMAVSDTYAMEHKGAPDTRNGRFYTYLRSLAINPYLEQASVRFRHNAVFNRPDTAVSVYLQRWIDCIRKTDQDPNQLYTFISKLGDPHPFQVVYFMNHHSIVTLSRTGHAPVSGSQAYVDGMALRKQLVLKGERRSFDFTGVAHQVFQQCLESGVRIGVIGAQTHEVTRFKTLIETTYPGLHLVVSDGFKPLDELVSTAQDMVQRDSVQVLILGLGSPLQELVVEALASLPALRGVTAFTCGGFISQTAASKDGYYYPEVFTRLNMRWLWRLMTTRYVWKRILTTYVHSYVLIRSALRRHREAL
jgi:UDP-Gal:alpha-D-GlcNAc-diphosphoundecaprenol beta-1,4-galactosyltransferase